jgi:hypothetical protein
MATLFPDLAEWTYGAMDPRGPAPQRGRWLVTVEVARE